MESFSPRQLACIASANKTVAWLFRVTDNLGITYYWSTGTQASSAAETVLSGALLAPGSYTGREWERAHTFKIVNFSGITLRRSKSESGIHAPNDVTFAISNKDNTLDAVNFSGGEVRIGLVIDDGSGQELCGSWRFRIKSASPYDQQIDVTCEDFLQEFLQGSYPNTRLISDIFPVTDGVTPDSMCIPEPYGTCYIPLRSVYTGADRYYILGDTVNTYTVNEVRSPRELGAEITWTSGGFTFTQSTVSGWRMFQAMIAGGDAGIFMSGDRILDVPTKFSRSDTVAVTGPAEIIRWVLRNMGLLDYDLDLASFDAAAATFAGWGLAWNFAFHYKEDRKTVLSRLLAMCHSCLVVGEKINLQVLSSASQKTITNAEVLKPQEVGPDTFKYTDAISERVSDSGYVAFQQTGESQDQFLKILVPAKSATDVIDAEVITFPGVQDTQQVQKLGTLYYQRKFCKAADISFTGKGTLLALRPDDVITPDGTDYGGTYNVLIDEITINPDVSVSISAIRFSEVLDDWADLAPGAITIASDTPTTAYSPVISGPDSVPSSGQMPNSLPGRLRVGQSADYVLLEPVSPLRVSLYSADVERLRIGNLNGFLGYVADTYGLAIGSAAKYLKYDPTNGLRLGGSGVARIELDLELARISVKDATNATKTAMGYLNGLARHDGTGNWGPGDYGFWAAAGDNLKIDGDAVYKSGDWIVENDGSYLIQNAAAQTIVRLGTVSGVKGLYIYDAATPTQNLLAKFATDGMYLGTPGGTNNYMQYTVAGGMVIRGRLNATDITVGTLAAARIAASSIAAAKLSFTNLAGLNATEGGKLAGIAAGADVTLSAIQGTLTVAGGGIILNSAGAMIRSGNYTPGDDGATQGTGFKINDLGNFEGWGTDQTFGGTVLSSDGNYMVAIGKSLTAIGWTKQYPLNNATNFTVGGKLHIYSWSGSAWVSYVDLGYNSDGVVGNFTNPQNSGVAIKGYESGADGYGVMGEGAGNSTGVWGLSNTGYGVIAETLTDSAGAPLLINPSLNATAPIHVARLGSLWVTSAGVLYINTDSSTTWQKVGAQ